MSGDDDKPDLHVVDKGEVEPDPQEELRDARTEMARSVVALWVTSLSVSAKLSLSHGDLTHLQHMVEAATSDEAVAMMYWSVLDPEGDADG